MAEEPRSNPIEEVQRLCEEAEKRTGQAFEEVVSRSSFGELLARMTENVVGLTKISTDAFDLILRNLRLAGRQDVTRLARQIGRTEDKLELVLQEVERLNDRLKETSGPAPRSRSERSGRAGRSASSNGRSSRASESAARGRK
jgi:hypothetical protein